MSVLVVCALLGLALSSQARARHDADSCWVIGDSNLYKKKVPVSIIRQLNEAQDLNDILRICSGGSSTTWHRISTYGYLLWQIRSYESDTMHSITSSGRELQTEFNHQEAPSQEKQAIDEDQMMSDAPVRRKRNSPILEKRAACIPRPVPIRVPQPRDPEALHYPTCADVLRCAGCCNHHLLSCRPKATRNTTRQAFVLRLAKNKTSGINFEGFKKVRFLEHTACHCECKVRPQHCSPHQVYREDSCQCACPNSWMAPNCTSLQVWDGRRCACVCRNPELECSTGFIYDGNLCRCVMDNTYYATFRRRRLVG
ncbi:balbiani ring protein 3-like [Ornithodoros turicata]|uniref:balbiani ring protein 3-like n=1 Tax=Ornithodoros turicata TaxID=34597 RepID=UPI0031392362